MTATSSGRDSQTRWPGARAKWKACRSNSKNLKLCPFRTNARESVTRSTMRSVRAIRRGCRSSRSFVRKLAVSSVNMLRLWHGNCLWTRRWVAVRQAGPNKSNSSSAKTISSYKTKLTTTLRRSMNVRTCLTRLRLWWRTSMRLQTKSTWILLNKESNWCALIKKWMM